jgi:hypothetical protein
MADPTGRLRTGAGAPDAGERDDVEQNAAQRQSDAAPDAVAGRQGDLVETSDRADGAGSTANGVPAAEDADGERRRKLYEQGATLVSRID